MLVQEPDGQGNLCAVETRPLLSESPSLGEVVEELSSGNVLHDKEKAGFTLEVVLQGLEGMRGGMRWRGRGGGGGDEVEGEGRRGRG